MKIAKLGFLTGIIVAGIVAFGCGHHHNQHPVQAPPLPPPSQSLRLHDPNPGALLGQTKLLKLFLIKVFQREQIVAVRSETYVNYLVEKTPEGTRFKPSLAGTSNSATVEKYHIRLASPDHKGKNKEELALILSLPNGKESRKYVFTRDFDLYGSHLFSTDQVAMFVAEKGHDLIRLYLSSASAGQITLTRYFIESEEQLVSPRQENQPFINERLLLKLTQQELAVVGAEKAARGGKIAPAKKDKPAKKKVEEEDETDE